MSKIIQAKMPSGGFLLALLLCGAAIAQNGPVRPPVDSEDDLTCQPIVLQLCQSVGYANASFPNFRGHLTQVWQPWALAAKSVCVCCNTVKHLIFSGHLLAILVSLLKLAACAIEERYRGILDSSSLLMGCSILYLYTP